MIKSYCLSLVLLLQTRYDVWRRVLKTFWAVVVGYSMVVLIDRHLHVPVQECVSSVQTNYGHVGGRVSLT